MKLITFGSTSEAQVVLNSPYVSSYHAELVLLDNGDMVLFDKGSKNGTYVNGARINPETAVTVTRRDQVVFADQPLNWASIPAASQADPSVKELRSIGSHSLNTIRLNDPQVSRFHATMKQTQKGDWLICDHSSNGTTINGTRLPKDQFVPFKKGDVIACAGVQIQNPIVGGKKSNGGLIAGIVVGAVAIVALVLVLLGGGNKVGGKDWSKIYAQNASSTVMVELSYYFRVTINDKEEYWSLDETGFVPYDGKNGIPSQATGFFISEQGLIVTNQHVTKPWLYSINEAITKEIREYYWARSPFALSDIAVDGCIAEIGVYPNGVIKHPSNLIPCRVLASSDIKEIDLGIIQTMDAKLPAGATYVPISKVAAEDVAVGTEVLSIGFPMGDEVQNAHGVTLSALSNMGIISKNNDKYWYNFDATSTYGASGSAIFDKKGNLVGVTYGGKGEKDYNYCIKSKYIHKLLQAMNE